MHSETLSALQEVDIRDLKRCDKILRQLDLSAISTSK